MAKTVTTLLGAAFLLIGLLGFAMPGFLGAHLTPAHNLIHLVSGALALYFGLSGTLAACRLFDIVFGSVYGLLGLLGFVVGRAGASPFHGMDSRLLEIMSGVLGSLGGDEVHISIKFHAARSWRLAKSSRAESSCCQAVASGLRRLREAGSWGSSTIRPGANTRPYVLVNSTATLLPRSVSW
jgi:hypothetical protein